MPLNRVGQHSREDLLELQDRARAARFLPGTVPDRVDLPLPLRRSPSFEPFDGPAATPVPNDSLLRVLRTLHDPDSRLYPSAGALYPVRIVVEQRTADGSDLIAFDQATGAFATVAAGRPPAGGLGLDPTLAVVGTRIWLVGSLVDTTAKYGARGYRYTLLEAGHAAQALIQVLGHAGFDCRPFGGFDDQAVASWLDLDDGVVPLYAIGVTGRADGTGGKDWVEAEQLRCTMVNGQPLYYANALGPRRDGARECGFGVDVSADGARIRARGELAERLALVSTARPIRNSNGMAAHTRLDAAADAAVFELYERHCYLRTWLNGVAPRSLTVPDSPLADTVQALCRSGAARLTLLDITDPSFGAPAVMAVVHGEGHGGIITASGAGADEPEAVARALREIAKALVYRLVLRKTGVFTEDNPVTGEITQPWEHEAWFAHRQVPGELTRFLRGDDAPRPVRSAQTDLTALRAAAVVEDLSADGPDERHWRVARATSDRMLLVDFGSPTPAFRARTRELLGAAVDVDARWPHPLG
jgi:hypothetical protein